MVEVPPPPPPEVSISTQTLSPLIKGVFEVVVSIVNWGFDPVGTALELPKIILLSPKLPVIACAV